jgi:CHAT domain-containing protein
LLVNGESLSAGIPDLSVAEKYLERCRMLYERLEYDSLPYYYLNAKTIFQQSGKPAQAAECYLGMADYYRLSLRFDQAEATLDSADIYIGEHLGRYSESWADALNTRAKLLIDGSAYEQAIDLLGQTMELLQNLDVAPEKMARTEDLLGSSYYSWGDMPKARDHYMNAYQIYQRISSEPTAVKGWLLFNISLLYSRMGNQREWKEFLTRSIANDIALFGPDYHGLAKSYNLLSGYFIENGMSDSAFYYLNVSEKLEKNAYGEDHRGLVTLYIQRARIYRLEGNYDRARDYYQQASEILRGNENSLGFQERKLYLNMSSFYRSIKEYDSAERVLLGFISRESSVHPTEMIIYYYYLADIERLLGNFDKSAYYYRNAFDISDRFQAPDHYSRIDGYLGYGILLDSLKQYNKAEEYYLQALIIAEKNYGLHHLKTTRIFKSAGDHFSLTGDPNKALVYYQKGIRSMVPEYDIKNLIDNPSPDNINDNLFYLGLLKNKAYVLEELAGKAEDRDDLRQRMVAAYKAYITSIHIIDLLRNSYMTDRSKMYLSANERDTYEKCVETAYRCYELTTDPEYLEQAFMVAEKGKYATLLSVLQREETIKLAGIPDSVVQLDASLRRELSFQQGLLLERQADSLYDTLAVERYKAGIFRLMAQIESLNKRLEREFPAYYDLLYNQRVTDPGSFRKKLRSGEKLLEYFYAGKNLYRFELTKQAMDCRRIRVDKAFERELSIVESFLSRDFLLDTLEVSHELFLAAAHSLHERLIPAPRDHSRLIIIPEGELSYFPFDILVTEPVHDFSGLYNEVPFLIRDHSIRYGYSATLMDRLEKGGRIKLNRLIAFAPGYGADLDMEASATDKRIAVDRARLRSLPGSIREAIEIGRISGGRAFTGESASEDLFKKLANEGHILHLATHAFLDDEDPLQSKLVFSDDNVVEDGFLNVYEIYNMDLRARMVVLSACNTGTGTLKRGEGIMSLARAFIYAGVPDIVMTLWTVSDRQSYRLMLAFYRLLIAGRSTEDALRKAKLELLDEASPSYQHPQYWAGYILVGNPDRFFMSRFSKFLVLLVLFTIVGLMGYLIILRRKMFRGRH